MQHADKKCKRGEMSPCCYKLYSASKGEAMFEVVREGEITAIDSGEEFTITHSDDSLVSEMLTVFKLAHMRGYSNIYNQYYDTDGDFQVMVLRREESN
jgi:hypothetical protein